MDEKSNEEYKSGNWREVGEKFNALGNALSEAFRATMDDPKTQEAFDKVREGLSQAVEEVEDAARYARENPKVQKFAEDAGAVFADFEGVGEETIEKTRPYLVRALKSLQTALGNLIEEIDSEE
jgi:CHASE3 domain sensor protein